MRLTPLISATLAIAVASPLFAQEWIEFASREDRFTCNFPTQPKVTETTYRSLHEADLPARIYSASQGQSRYSVTVIDYTQAQRILTEKAKSCPAGAEPCLGGPGDEGHWKADIRGAIDYASWQLMQRDAKLTLFVWGVVDMVEGRRRVTRSPGYSSNRWVGSMRTASGFVISPTTPMDSHPRPASTARAVDKVRAGLTLRTLMQVRGGKHAV